MEGTDSVWSIVRNLHQIAQLQRRAAARSEWGPVATGLLSLAARGPVRPKTAAEEFDVAPQSITRATADLVTAGLVRRAADGADGRSYLIELTDEGRIAHEQFRAELQAAFSRHLAGWTEQEIDEFAERLNSLTASLAADVPAADAHAPVHNSWRTP